MLLYIRRGTKAEFYEILQTNQDSVTVIRVKTLCGTFRDAPYYTTWGEKVGKPFNIRRMYLNQYVRTEYGKHMW